LAVSASCAELTQCDPTQCDNIKSPLKDYIAQKDRGGLNGMCEAAEGTRKDIIGEELPYDVAAEQARAWYDNCTVFLDKYKWSELNLLTFIMVLCNYEHIQIC